MKNFNRIRKYAKYSIQYLNAPVTAGFVFAAILLLAFTVLPPAGKAQTVQPGELDLSFNPTINFTPLLDNRVIVQPDGKIIVAGGFTVVNGASYKNIVRLNSDGTVDTGFNPGTGPNNAISSLVLQPDGKILVGGAFTSFNGTTRNRVVRLNSDGSLDATFDPGTGANSSVRSLALQPDGKVLVGGFFTAFNGTPQSSIVRLNPNGSLDPSFVTTADTGGTVNTIAVQSDGKVLIGGQVSANNLFNLLVARLNANGSFDSAFTPPTNPSGRNQTAYAMAVQPDGKILVAGGFYHISGSNRNGIARLNPNGSLDASFNAGTGVGEDDIVESLAFQPNGKILIGGSITSVNGTARSNIARLNPDGSLDTTFITSANSDVFSIAISPNGGGGQKVVISGDFTAVNGTARARLARLSIEQFAVSHTAFDFDGDGKSDYGVFRPSAGVWYLQQTTAGLTGVTFGQTGDKLVPADYDGDGKTDVAVYRAGTWYLQRSTAGLTGIAFGAADDIPVPADYDGDGRADIAVFRPSNGTWYIQQSTNGFTGIAFGQSGDKPVAGDYDGDGKADVAVFRAGTWYIQRSTAGFTGFSFGLSSDAAVPADYDGDGKTDAAVFRPSTGTWYTSTSAANNYGAVQFGISTDIAVPADYDGDGKADVAVFRNGTWYIQRSTAGFTSVSFGASTDTPLPNVYVR